MEELVAQFFSSPKLLPVGSFPNPEGRIIVGGQLNIAVADIQFIKIF